MLWGPTQPHISNRELSPGLKRPGHATEYSPPPSVEINNAWCSTSISPYRYILLQSAELNCLDQIVGNPTSYFEVLSSNLCP
jgi:hypothetical protein